MDGFERVYRSAFAFFVGGVAIILILVLPEILRVHGSQIETFTGRTFFQAVCVYAVPAAISARVAMGLTRRAAGRDRVRNAVVAGLYTWVFYSGWLAVFFASIGIITEPLHGNLMREIDATTTVFFLTFLISSSVALPVALIGSVLFDCAARYLQRYHLGTT